ncbi:hypothetical protein HDU91_002644 [Kappamyces sp. JEL0680]|nr:hypothetical protein HDU91_002644 [Kappamyces sp. JEL0680]
MDQVVAKKLEEKLDKERVKKTQDIEKLVEDLRMDDAEIQSAEKAQEDVKQKRLMAIDAQFEAYKTQAHHQ